MMENCLLYKLTQYGIRQRHSGSEVHPRLYLQVWQGEDLQDSEVSKKSRPGSLIQRIASAMLLEAGTAQASTPLRWRH